MLNEAKQTTLLENKYRLKTSLKTRRTWFGQNVKYKPCREDF